MNMNKTDTQGNGTVSRNLHVGANARVNGNASVGHNLRVEGWLDAPNIKGPGKGLYVDADVLREEYPHPWPGWWALVDSGDGGETARAEVWIVGRDGHWTGTRRYVDHIRLNDAHLSASVAGILETVGDHGARIGALEDADVELAKDVKELSKDVTELSGSVGELTGRVDAAEAGVGRAERGLEDLGRRMESQEQASSAIADSVRAIAAKLDSLAGCECASHRAFTPGELDAMWAGDEVVDPGGCGCGCGVAGTFTEEELEGIWESI